MAEKFTKEVFAAAAEGKEPDLERFKTRTFEIAYRVAWNWLRDVDKARNTATTILKKKTKSLTGGRFDPCKGQSRNPDINYVGWVRHNTIKLVYSILKQCKKKRILAEAYAAESGSPSDPGFLVDQVELEAQRRKFIECLETMPHESYRQVLRLKLQGLTIKEIADHLKIHEDKANTDFNRAQYAREWLKQCGIEADWFELTREAWQSEGSRRKLEGVGRYGESEPELSGESAEEHEEEGGENQDDGVWPETREIHD